jgi:hypothetical protein
MSRQGWLHGFGRSAVKTHGAKKLFAMPAAIIAPAR